MGLLDDISGALGALGQSGSGQLSDVLSQVLGKTDLGSVSGLLTKLQQGGLGSQVGSWLSNGTNMPVSSEQLRSALGTEHLQQLGNATGLPIDNLLGMLSKYLPQTVDNMSPNGTLEEQQRGDEGGSLEDQAGLRDIKG